MSGTTCHVTPKVHATKCGEIRSQKHLNALPIARRSNHLAPTTRLRLAYPVGPLGSLSEAGRRYRMSRAAVRINRKAVARIHDNKQTRGVERTVALWEAGKRLAPDEVPLYIVAHSFA